MAILKRDVVKLIYYRVYRDRAKDYDRHEPSSLTLGRLDLEELEDQVGEHNQMIDISGPKPIKRFMGMPIREAKRDRLIRINWPLTREQQGMRRAHAELKAQAKAQGVAYHRKAVRMIEEANGFTLRLDPYVAQTFFRMKLPVYSSKP